MNDIELDGVYEDTKNNVSIKIQPCGCASATEHISVNHVKITYKECDQHKPTPCKNCHIPVIQDNDGNWCHNDVGIGRCENPQPMIMTELTKSEDNE